jgi:endonuclease-8
MPEGAEVRRQADRLARVLVGRPLARVWFGLDRLAAHAGDLEAAGVHAVEARGKAFLLRFGPDALDPTLPAEAVAERLASRTFRGRSLAALYLDQSFVAGIGNYLRTEILFVAGLLPERRAKDLSPEQRVALAEATLAVTRQSYATAGITNDLARASALKASGEPRGRYRHHVFARGGRACWACGAVIERVELAGRRMYVCGSCQR